MVVREQNWSAVLFAIETSEWTVPYLPCFHRFLRLDQIQTIAFSSAPKWSRDKTDLQPYLLRKLESGLFCIHLVSIGLSRCAATPGAVSWTTPLLRCAKSPPRSCCSTPSATPSSSSVPTATSSSSAWSARTHSQVSVSWFGKRDERLRKGFCHGIQAQNGSNASSHSVSDFCHGVCCTM